MLLNGLGEPWGTGLGQELGFVLPAVIVNYSAGQMS
jgi:hypothetical protein